jgi:hypothetical protein
MKALIRKVYTSQPNPPRTIGLFGVLRLIFANWILCGLAVIITIGSLLISKDIILGNKVDIHYSRQGALRDAVGAWLTAHPYVYLVIIVAMAFMFMKLFIRTIGEKYKTLRWGEKITVEIQDIIYDKENKLFQAIGYSREEDVTVDFQVKDLLKKGESCQHIEFDVLVADDWDSAVLLDIRKD